MFLIQAPLDLTVYHFYQMIMHENVTIIIMLCNFTESGRKVCNEYYPLTKKDAALMFGDITVICLRVSYFLFFFEKLLSYEEFI